MEGNVFVTGADRGLGLALCAGLLQQGWNVFAGQYMPDWHELPTLAKQYPQTLHLIPLDVASMESVRSAAQKVSALADHVDVLINNAGVNSHSTHVSIREPQDYSEMYRLYDVNALGPLRMVEAFLPLMERGNAKRLCFVSSEAGSITRAERTSWFSYCMSKAALNMAVKILHNDLHPAGYSFRVYHPGNVHSYMNTTGAMETQEAAARAIPILLNTWEKEDRLVMVDYEGKEWPW
jgi:NAD(P)-dependent dehydrogenase (short-subunit alcohol dehydrogenase family)